MNYAGKFDTELPADGLSQHFHEHGHVETIIQHATHAPAGAIIVPDAQLLFNGDFKRSGVDLVLSGDDHELVLHDYFKGEKRAALASPDGAHLTGDIVSALTGHTEYAQADGSASAGKVIGHVTKLAGTATAVRNGVSVILHQGDNVEKGDVVESGSDSTLGITFIDGTVFGLSSNSRMVLNEMVYDPNGSNNSSLISLVAGTISFVAGETAKHGDMKVDTPVATMGIRGTAVLVEIDFDVPGTGGAPEAKFQVLVEPDGTTGSYILFDKTTLTAIATVNQAGQQINISQGQVSITNAPLPPDVQKLITDVFSLKFTDSNPQTLNHFTDTIVPQSLQPIQLASGASATPVVINISASQDASSKGTSGSSSSLQHIDGPPTAVILDANGNATTGFSVLERPGTTGDATDFDTASGKFNFVDINAGDAPTVSAKFSSFTYQNAVHQDVTATLNAQQLADIAAVEANLLVVPAPGNNNNGSATWTYSIADKAFDFLAAGETLVLTYTVKVDNNYAPNDEATALSFTITVTGTNDVPVIATGPQFISFLGGTSVPGGDLTSTDATSGTLSFTDVDLTDTHTVATRLANATLSGGSLTLNEAGLDTLAPKPMAVFEQALSATVAGDSTGTGSGTISWKLADLSVYLADFIPKGETLTLTYAVTVTDSQGATSTQDVTVAITGTDTPAVVWIAATTAGSASGGLWSDASNWETGTVPTVTDDAIIITNQLIGLTPSYPVTIDAPAVAKTVTMNDFNDLGNAHPQLINQSTLTIGGTFSLSVDSEVDNSGTISVGGLMEVLNSSVLQNSGLITLQLGGDFKDQSSITNSGTIDVSGGTLNVLVGIANAGGNITVDGPSTLTQNGTTISGGTLTISGILDSTGTSAITSVDVTNMGLIEVTSGVLTIDPATLMNSGTVKANGGELGLTGETVTNTGTLKATNTSVLELTSTTVTNTSGTVTVDAGSTLGLNGSTISGGTLSNSGILDSTGTSAITNAGATNSGTLESTAGTLTVNSASTLTNSGTLQANGGELDITSDPVPNAGTLQAIDSSTLKLTSLTVSDTGGTVTVGSGSTLDLVGAAIIGGTLGNAGTFDSSGTSAITDVGITNSGLIEATGGVLTIDPVAGPTLANSGTLQANGGELDITSDPVTNTGTLQAIDSSTLKLTSLTVSDTGGTVTVGSGSTLDLVGAAIIGGTLGNAGTFDSSGSSAITDVGITNSGLIEATGGVLTIDPVAGPTLANSGTLRANGGELDITSDPVTNTGTLQAIDSSTLKLTSLTVSDTGGTVTVGSGSTLDLVGAAIIGGHVTNAGTIHSNGVSAMIGLLDMSNTGTIEVQSGTLDVGGTSTVKGGSILIDGGATLELSGGIWAPIVTFSAMTGTLKLDNAQNFYGVISGFGGDGTLAGSDHIDLANINYHSTTFSEHFNAHTDVLTVSDGTNTAVLQLVGSYSAANFEYTSDGGGGTIVYDPPVSSDPAFSARGAAIGARDLGVIKAGSTINDGFNFKSELGTWTVAKSGSDEIKIDHATVLPVPANVVVAPSTNIESDYFISGEHHVSTMPNGAILAQLHGDGFPLHL